MQWFRDILNPRTYTSPSGEYALSVNPSNSEGKGGATYRLTRRDVVVWEGTRPYTLYEAGVADDGAAGGFAYSQGRAGFGEGRGYGDFEIVILDATGKPRLHQKVPRTGSRFLHDSPNPLALGVIVDGANDRMMVRVRDEDINRGNESWWVYQLSTGKEVRRFIPKRFMALNGSRPFIITARAVPGTPLTLLHWWRYENGNPSKLGAWFTLIDAEGKPVWNRELPQDYNIPASEDAQDKLMDEIRKDGAILATASPGQFTLRFVAEKKRVTFAVTAEAEGKWRVSEIRREAYIRPSPVVARATASEMRLRLKDTITLRVPGSPPPHPINKVFRLVAAGMQRFAFLHREDFSTLVVVNHRGEAIHRVSLRTIPQKPDDNVFNLLWLGGTKFLVFVERDAPTITAKSTEVYQVDARTGAVTRFARLPSGRVEKGVAFPDGGFALLVNLHFKYTITHQVVAFDARGQRTWGFESDGWRPDDGPEKLFSPESIAVLKDGTVAVLDVIRHTVQLYTRQGRYRSTIELDKAWGRKARYPTDIIADTRGGFIVHDYPASPSVVWMDTAGKVLRSFTPRYPNGVAMENPELAVTPDGSLWASDSYSLLRLEAQGRTAQRLGEAPHPKRLGVIAELLILPDGRILAADERTRTVHIFNAKGRWLHACPPRKGLPESPGLAGGMRKMLEPGPDDSFVMDEDWFDANGKPMAKPANYRTVGGRLEKISRRPDGTWREFVWEYTSAPNGGLAVVDEIGGDEDKQRYFISLYSPTNAPERMIPLPPEINQTPTIAYDGRRVVFIGGGRIYSCRADGTRLWQSPLPSPDPYAAWRPFLTEQGKTLCLFDGRRTVYRYAMPG